MRWIPWLVLGITAACAPRGEATSDDGSALSMSDLPVRVGASPEKIFQQALDHPKGGSAVSGTFAQRYWVNSEFASGPDSPVLFYICPESECGDWIFNRALADSAKTLHASMVALEHRYYGKSLPFHDLSLEHMKYLTIHNALEDAAAFERFAKKSLPLRGKWISVGGSYGGMLSAFYREKHPELVVGAWSSSAPVNVQLSFWGYDALTSRALGPDCTRQFQGALKTAAARWDDESQRNALGNALLGFEPDPDREDDFLRRISKLAMQAAQNGDVMRLCAALGQHADNPIDGLLGYVSPPLPSDDPVKPGPVGPGEADGAPPGLPSATGLFRLAQWNYQVCTEVGFYQVHNPDRNASIMSDLVDDSTFDKNCDSLVGIRPNIEATRQEYVAPIMAGKVSNIFFVNGSLDPWSTLSITDPKTAPAGTDLFMVSLGAHCDDLTNLTPTTPLPIFEAHVKFNQLARRWLSE